MHPEHRPPDPVVVPVAKEERGDRVIPVRRERGSSAATSSNREA
jgi:hypothetical protein